MKTKIAQALLEIEAIKFVVDQPITFKSGMRSPVYVDNRILPFHPSAWQLVLTGFEEKIKSLTPSPAVIAGIETAGIPHSATLGYILKKPSVFIRKKAKDHGTRSLIEGGEVKNKQVLLIEDHVTTGGSSLAGVEAIRQAGGRVDTCLCITSYSFPESRQAFAKAQVELMPLLEFSQILRLANQQKLITQKQEVEITKWLTDPWNWQQ